MGIKTTPFILRGNLAVTGDFRVDASANITGKLQCATAIQGDASGSFALDLACATALTSCGQTL